MQKRFLKATLPAVLFATSFAVADYHGDDQKKEHMYSNNNQSSLDDRVITPNASPIVQHGVDVFISADFIYWTGRLDNLQYAYNGVATGSSADDAAFVDQTTGVNVPQGGFSFVKRKWSPGFKVGIGLDLGHDGWDLGAEYTWFRTHPSGRTDGGTTLGTILVPAFSINPTSGISGFMDAAGTGSNTATSNDFPATGYATASYRLHFNNIDLSLGRNFFVSPRLTTRPHFGLKGTWQTQRFKPAYEDVTASADDGDGTTTTLSNACYHINFKQNYWGVGIRTGMDTSWQFMKSFGIFGNWALSALWGQFDVTRKDWSQSTVTTTVDGTSTAEVILPSYMTNVVKKFHTLSAVLELALGLRYDYWFSDNDYRFRIQAGWEEQIWFDQNQLFYMNQTSPLTGNLIFQGLTLKVRFDF